MNVFFMNLIYFCSKLVILFSDILISYDRYKNLKIIDLHQNFVIKYYTYCHLDYFRGELSMLVKNENLHYSCCLFLLGCTVMNPWILTMITAYEFSKLNLSKQLKNIIFCNLKLISLYSQKSFSNKRLYLLLFFFLKVFIFNPADC